MLLERIGSAELSADFPTEALTRPRWGVASEMGRLTDVLARSGFQVIAVEVDQFTRCGGLHCLTMPLARERGHARP